MAIASVARDVRVRLSRLDCPSAGPFRVPVLATLTVAAWLATGSPAPAASCTELPESRQIRIDGDCLALVPVSTPTDTRTEGGARTLVVLIHGDRGGVLRDRHIEEWTRVGQTLQAPDRAVTFLIRPGYRTPSGDSSGLANPKDDDYTPQFVERIARAVTGLKERHTAENVILVGHSGGAAISALVLGRHPGAADAALLLGCPCDVPPWRAHRSAQRGRDATWRMSLNPLSVVDGIPPVIAATGADDDNTLPRFARRWVEAAAESGVSVMFEQVDGYDHRGIVSWPGVADRVSRLASALAE
jgi:pimeloyl-ACP methyl ester carboxylesterase